MGFLQSTQIRAAQQSYQDFMWLSRDQSIRGSLAIRRLPLLKLRHAMPRISHSNERGHGMRVAVIGTGIAGNAAAWTLSKRYPVTVYDRELRPGGHSHTVTIDYDGTPLAVDIGFIVYNELNYPDLTAAVRPSRMSRPWKAA